MLRRFVALLLSLVFIGALGPSVPAWARIPVEGGGSLACSGGGAPDLVVNGQAVCHLDPRPYLKSDRNMYGLRSIAEALSLNGTEVTLDYWRVPDEHGRVKEYVSVISRHRELLFQIGSKRARVWATNPDTGVKSEQDAIYMDVAPEIVDDRTRLPLRYAVEGLDGSIDGWDPYVEVTYVDTPTNYEYRLADSITQGASQAYHDQLITRQEFDFLADYSQFWADMGRMNTGSLPWDNPVAYIRWMLIDRIVSTGHRPTDADFKYVASETSIGLGRKVDQDQVRKTGQIGESNMRTAAELIPELVEAGRDPVTGQFMDFGPYNRLKAQNPNWNGPDAIFVVLNHVGDIAYIIVGESKATGRPWVSPSRFEENPPLEDQLQNLQRWNNETVRQTAENLQSLIREQERLRAAGEITDAEFTAHVQVIRMDFASSRSGGISQGYAAVREAAGQSYVSMDLKGQITRIFQAWLADKKNE